MPLVLNENAANVNVLLTIVDDNNNGIPDITFDDPDLAIYYFKDSATAWVELTLVAGTLGAWTANGFVELPDSNGEYLLGLPAAAITARKTTMLKIVYGMNKPLRDIVAFVGSPAYPSNFAVLAISPEGKVSTNPDNLEFSVIVPGGVTLEEENSNVQLFVKETDREITLVANQNIEAIDIKVVFETTDQIDLAIVPNSALTKSGVNAVFTLPDEVTDTVQVVRWAARNETTNVLYGQGEFPIRYAPFEDEPPVIP